MNRPRARVRPRAAEGNPAHSVTSDEVFAERHFGYPRAPLSAMLSAMFHESRKDEDSSESLAENPFRILAIYDSPKASVEAARASAVVIRELGEDVPVDRCSWSVEALERVETRGFAAGEAARADLIVLALSSETPSEGLKE